MRTGWCFVIKYNGDWQTKLRLDIVGILPTLWLSVALVYQYLLQIIQNPVVALYEA